MKLAPIVLFTYNRLEHTKKTVDALLKNELANQSELFIYSDGGKDEESWEKVDNVREYLKTIKGFKNITLTFQGKNIGLANSIISGVTDIVNKYEKIIVLEDDIVTSPYFLRFMNEALSFYENEKKVWQVSGWFFPINNDGIGDIVFHHVMNCWGWGTWRNRWQFFQKDTKNIINKYSKEEIMRFNLDDADHSLWWQIILNDKGIFNTWAIFWHEIIFRNNGFYVNPIKTLIKNIGIDGSGIHHGSNDYFYNEIDIDFKRIIFSNNIINNTIATDRIKLFFYKNGSRNPSKLYTKKLSLHFSKSLNKLFNFIQELQKHDEMFILYGSGSGFDIVMSQFNNNQIKFILDSDIKKHNSTKNGLKIIGLDFLQQFDDKKTKIIITTFGRCDNVFLTLFCDYKINRNRIINLDIIDTLDI